MAYETNIHQTQPFCDALRRWWSRPLVSVPDSNEHQTTCKEFAAMWAPFFAGFLTVGIVFLIFSSIDEAPSHARISLQSLAVSSATWQGHFLVKIPSSRYCIYYDVDGAAVRLGSQNAAVLNITSERVSRDGTAFSLVFVAEEENRSDVVSGELEIKLRAKHKRYLGPDSDEAGHFNIRCQNVTRGREKIICESSFTHFKLLRLTIVRRGAIETSN